jgi:hypothetical protein
MTRRKSRPVRAPLGRRLRLEIPKQYIEEGYVYRVVNDEPGRLDDFVDHGWEFVKKQGSKDGDGIDSNLSFYVGLNIDGSPKLAYGMKIQQEWYDEDQKTKQAENDLVDESIRAGSTNVPNAYTPNQPSPTVVESPVKIGS